MEWYQKEQFSLLQVAELLIWVNDLLLLLLIYGILATFMVLSLQN
jgi:hypothetical protein